MAFVSYQFDRKTLPLASIHGLRGLFIALKRNAAATAERAKLIYGNYPFAYSYFLPTFNLLSFNQINLQQYLVIINQRTFIALLTALVTTYMCFRFDVHFDIDLTLISIAMIFPLVFTIRGSFRRREKALEHLSEFRSTLKTLYYFFTSNNLLTEEEQVQVKGVLINISNTVMTHLRTNEVKTDNIDKSIHEVYSFVDQHIEALSGKRKEKIFRFLKDLHESVENVHAINIHRTPISLKAYCLIFIYIFPLIYAPSIINSIGYDHMQWITYAIVMTSQFILIALYNIQNQLEYPFDDKGLDDIKLDNFRFDR